jgi:hypothetical protein
LPCKLTNIASNTTLPELIEVGGLSNDIVPNHML